MTSTVASLSADLAAALADVVGAQVGAHGYVPRLGRERTEEILLLLLRAGKTVPAHKRVWQISIPADLEGAIRAAGGFLSRDELAAAEAKGSA